MYQVPAVSPGSFVTFRHFRFLDTTNLGLAARGGICVCVLADPVSSKLFLSYAECSTKENYSRKAGRDVSILRMIHGKFVVVPWIQDLAISHSIRATQDELGHHYRTYQMVISRRNRKVST